MFRSKNRAMPDNKLFPCQAQIFVLSRVAAVCVHRQFPPSAAFLSPTPALDSRLMEVSETILCPFCGQAFEITLDTSIASQRFTTDCEVCCRPFEVAAQCEPGEILSLEVSGN
jgi:hypothetical protein